MYCNSSYLVENEHLMQKIMCFQGSIPVSLYTIYYGFNHFVICILTIPLHTYNTNSHYYIILCRTPCWEWPKRPKLGGLPHVYTLIIVQLLDWWLTAYNTNNFKHSIYFGILYCSEVYFKQSDVNIHVMVSLRGLLHAGQPLSSVWITAITLNLATRAFHTGIHLIGMIFGFGLNYQPGNNVSKQYIT